MDRRKAFQLAATLLALCAAVLSLLPNGMGMVFLGETSPIQYIVSPCPILSLTAVGYGMPFPFLSAVLAIILVILGILGLFLDRPGLRGAQFYLSLLAFLLSTCIPVFSLSGSLQCTWVSTVYCVLLLLHFLAAGLLRK